MHFIESQGKATADDSTPPGNQWRRGNNFRLHYRMSTLSAWYSYHHRPDIPHGLARGRGVFPRCTEPYIRLRTFYLTLCHSGAILTMERHQHEIKSPRLRAWLFPVRTDYLQPPKPHKQFPGPWRCQVHNLTGTVSPPRQSSALQVFLNRTYSMLAAYVRHIYPVVITN
jgi:hypothetical protein